MAVVVNLQDIELKDLNNECLLLISKFARALKAHNGKALRLQDKDILMRISKHTRATRNAQLKNIYAELKQEIKKSIIQRTH